jgi:CRISPR-associated protein Cas2
VVQGARWWLVCYDVRDEKRLRRTAKHMEGYGERVQYSVFRCWLTPREAERLRWELTELLEAEDDVLLIPLCGRCQAGMRVTHAAVKRPDWPGSPESFRIV